MYELLRYHIIDILEINEETFELIKNDVIENIKCEILREKAHIYNNYYDFIKNDKCITFLERVYNTIKISKEIKIMDKDKFVLSIIVLKSFLDKKNIIEEDEKYVNSDDIYNYVSDQFIKYLISVEIHISERKIKNLVIMTLDILGNAQVINQKLIRFRDSNYKTYKYFFIENLIYVKNIRQYFNYSYMEYKLFEYDERYYITTIHYSKTCELNKKNFYSDKSFKIKNKSYILSKINTKLYIDKNYQKILRDNVIIDVDLSIIKIRKLLEDLKLLYDKELWNSNTKNELSKKQKEVSSITDELINNYFAKYDFMDVYIFFPMFLDFRGRKYYSSKISPTSSKLLRLSYYYGIYDEYEINSQISIFSEPYKDIIDAFCINNKLNIDINLYDGVFWCLIGIGKHFIDKNRFPIELNEFIEKGMSYYEKKNYLELSKKVEILHYENIIKSLSFKVVLKRVIMKDATASIYQILMKKLGPKDYKSLDYVNLGKESKWYDTYLVQRSMFYESILNENLYKSYLNLEVFEKHFPRKLIKNMIMIIPYSAGWELCWKNYVESIKDNNIDINYNDKEFKKLWKKFYKFIKNDIQSLHLYKKSSNVLIKKMTEDFESLRQYVMESDSGEADISYMKMKKSSIDVKYMSNGVSKRATKLVMVPSKAIDINSFNISSGANMAHFLDADEIREIELELKFTMLTIHDCFLIDVLNCTKLVKVKISHYKKNMYKHDKNVEISNIFILL